MKVYAISDLHLSSAQVKPMEIFGCCWENYWELIESDWRKKVAPDDIVLIPGDISWAMRLEDALPDIKQFSALNGKKIILRGNHDYWWAAISKVRAALPQNTYALQNDCFKFGNVIVCGSRCWTCPGSTGFDEKEDRRIYEREVLRLEMSFAAAAKLREKGDKLICMTHFPPFNVNREDSGFTKLIASNNADAVVYGHLHGKDARADLVLNKFGTTFYLASTDLTGHKLVEIK